MSVVTELIRTEENKSISFGNYELEAKAKLDHYAVGGDLYKVKTFREITKLERNDLFVYESVPGTAVESFQVSQEGVEFEVSGPEDAQITLGMEEDCEYLVLVDGHESGRIRTGRGGKLVLSVELAGREKAGVKVTRA